MTKEELIEKIQELETKIQELESRKSSGRKEQIISLLQEGRKTIDELSEKLGITNRNVSSQLSYLRKDGWKFGKDSKKRIFIEED